MPSDSCACIQGKFDWKAFDASSFGKDLNDAESFLLKCKACGRKWLRYLHVDEAMPDSDRWFCGEVSSQVAASVSAATAAEAFERFAWYWRGGGYYGGKVTKASGGISLM